MNEVTGNTDVSISVVADWNFKFQMTSTLTAILHNISLMPGERLELSRVAPPDFESGASTNSAIPAKL